MFSSATQNDHFWTPAGSYNYI